MKPQAKGKTNLRSRWRDGFTVSFRDTMVFLAIIGAAAAVCFLLRSVDDGDIFVSMIFVLAVFLISCLTRGYFYGTAASVAAVLFVNYAFTYPYYEFNLSISGYPLTFFTMIAVSLVTSTMTTKLKEHEKLQAETEKEKMRANLLRAVSHDLRTPLTSIIGSISVLLENEETLDAAERTRLLKESKTEAEWLVRMVENLLSVTKIRSGGAELKKNPEMVEEVVSEAVQKFNKHFPGRKVRVTVPEEPLLVPMDAILIEQVINNLLSNTVLHSGCSEPAELLVNKVGDRVYFSVRDYGQGLDEKKRPSIFLGAFNRDGEPGCDSGKGMGIGLSVCRSIVNAHHGEMDTENAADGGAIFWFWLPAEESGQSGGR